jgi:hypothetical protein
MKAPLVTALSMLALNLAASPALPAGTVPPERWVATSTTALSITGDVSFTPERLRLSNGATVRLRFIALRPIDRASAAAQPAGSARFYRAYRVTGGGAVRGLRGNAFCQPAATYLTVAFAQTKNPAGTSVFTNVYSGAAAPARWDDARDLCASYNYELR